MEKKSKYNIAIIGCGWIGLGAQLDALRIKPASHAEAAAMGKRTRLSALVDTNKKSLAHASRLYPNVPRFSDTAAMLATIKPDIVVIATQPESHCALIKQVAAARPRAILCEKPISHNSREAREAIRLCKKNNVLLFVNHMRRFDPEIRRFRDYVRGGYVKDTFIGAIKSAVAYYDKGLYHGGTHFIDLLMYFLGPARWVSAIEHSDEPKEKGDIKVEALLGFDGCTAALQYFDSKEYALSEISFFGTKGRLNLKHMTGLEIEVVGTRASEEYSSYRELDYNKTKRIIRPRSFLAPLLPHVIDCIEKRDTPVSTGEDAFRTLEVMKAIEKSARAYGRVEEV